MDHWPLMHTFYAVVQAGSFVGAANHLELTPSVISKRVAKLEEQLGAQLLRRSTRKLALTEAGHRLAAHCARIIAELQQAEEAVHSLQSQPRGQLRITTVQSISQLLLTPMLANFHARYPDIQLQIHASDQMVDLLSEGFDLALRVTDRPPPDMVAKRLTTVKFAMCASPKYLAKYGAPEDVSALASHVCLGYSGLGDVQWLFRHHGQPVQAAVTPALEVNSAEILRQLVLDGVGLALLPNYSVVDDLKQGRLQQVLNHYQGFGAAHLYAVYPASRFGSPKLHAFIACLEERIQELNL